MENKVKINGNQLIELGYPVGKVIGIALEVIQKEYSLMESEEVLDIMKMYCLLHPIFLMI